MFFKTSQKIFALIVLVFIPVYFGGSAFASTFEYEIINSFYASPNSTVFLQDAAVAESDQGDYCQISVSTANQISVHPGNNLVVRSGGEEVLIEGIEESGDFVFEDVATIVLGEDIEFYLELGDEGLTSIFLRVELNCSELVEVPAVTAPQLAVTTPTTPATTLAPTTTTPVATTAIVSTTQVPTASGFGSDSDSKIDLGSAPPAKAVAGSPGYTG